MAKNIEPGERDWRKDGVNTTQEYERSGCTLTTTSDSLLERVAPAASPRTRAQSHRKSPPAGTQMSLHQRRLVVTHAQSEHCEGPYGLELALRSEAGPKGIPILGRCLRFLRGSGAVKCSLQ